MDHGTGDVWAAVPHCSRTLWPLQNFDLYSTFDHNKHSLTSVQEFEVGHASADEGPSTLTQYKTVAAFCTLEPIVHLPIRPIADKTAFSADVTSVSP